jgi:hypothetical protein
VEPRDPSQPGFGLPAGGSDAAKRAQAQVLTLRPRAAAWLYVAPISLVGLALSSCNFFIVISPGQAWSGGLVFAAAAFIGLCIFLAPLLNFFNAEVRFANGVVSKRGLLRRVSRWQASDLDRIHSYIRYVGGEDYEFLKHAVYRFMLKSGGIAFAMTQAWWKTSDIEALARALNLYIPAPSEV